MLNLLIFSLPNMFQVPTRQIFLPHAIYFIFCSALKQADMRCTCDTLYDDTNYSPYMYILQ